MPNVSCSTLAIGARQLVVHDAFEMMWCLPASYLSSLTPSTTVMSGFFAGAVMTTFFAPAAMCFAASSRLVKMPGGLEHDVDAERLPRQLRRILDREHLELVAVDGDAVAARGDVGLQVAEDRVVLEQVRQRLGVGQVVDGDDVDPAVAHGGAHDVAADAAEPVDPDFDGHRKVLRRALAVRMCPAAAPKPLILMNGLRGGQTADYSYRLIPDRMYAAYSVLIVAFFVVMSPYLLYQAVRYRKYIASLQQRMGYLPVSFNLDGDESIWIHAVSVGEVLTARALLPELRERYPRLRIFLSTTTMTGQQVAAKQPASTSTRSSTFRSTSASSSTGRCGWCGRGSSS